MSGQLPYDPAAEGAETSFEARMAYGDYLHLDEILGAQKPLTRAHDEMLFIVQHQVSELWMRLAIHEIDAARRAVAGDVVPARLQDAFPRRPDFRATQQGPGHSEDDDAKRIYAFSR